MSTILVTGGAGYIGAHVVAALSALGRRCVCVDNFSNSSPRALERLRALAPGLVAHEADIRDSVRMRTIVEEHAVDGVIHLAGLKAVGESVEQPLRYYDNNVTGTLRLLQALQGTAARNIVFSSSATVYGAGSRMPVDEGAPTAPQNPYGQSKLMIERILVDLAASDASWRVANLRYFNPVGAHESGRIGEEPAGTPNNLMPYVCQVAAGQREALQVFGDDYPTADGTGVRDYIHVQDLVEGHVAALDALERARPGSTFTVNLGTGRGYSVLELVEAFERVNGVKVARRIVGRRAGDIAVCYADASLAKKVFGWEARRGIEAMCRDAWRWQCTLTSPSRSPPPSPR